jgi:hypothetical protein
MHPAGWAHPHGTLHLCGSAGLDVAPCRMNPAFLAESRLWLMAVPACARQNCRDWNRDNGTVNSYLQKYWIKGPGPVPARP